MYNHLDLFHYQRIFKDAFTEDRFCDKLLYMKKYFFILSLVFGLVILESQASNLPECKKQGYWTNCFGTYTWSDGDKYVGEWKDDIPDGQGTYTWSDGDKYVGEFKDGKRDGQGTFTYAAGSSYVGEWKADKNGDAIE